MKVETKKAIDVAQAVGNGAAAATSGAMGVAITSTFATLLNSFTAGDTKQAALKSADFTSSTKTATPSVAASSTKAKTAKDTSKQYGNAATKAAAQVNAASTTTPGTVANNESNESNENDADADNAAKTGTKNATAQAAKAPEGTQAADQAQQPVKMEEVIKTLNLNEQQVQQLAQALNMSVSDLKQMQITFKTDAQTGAPQLTGLMADGKEQNLSTMLGMNSTDGKTASAQAVMDKIAGILNLDTNQKQSFFAQLNISSISFNDATTANGSNGATTIKNGDTAKQADQTQPSTKETPTAVDLGKIAVQDNAQSGTNGNGGNPFGGEAGAQGAIVMQKNDAVVEQTQNTDFTTALNKAAEAAVVNATQAAKVETTQATAMTASVETAKPDAKVMSQIVEKASILQFPNSTQTKISLNPKELGTVDIKLTMHDSSVTASILVENHAVKQVVEANLTQLKHALQQQGITVDEMQVSVNQQNRDNSQNPNNFHQEAAVNTPSNNIAPKLAEPATVGAAFMRRPTGNHRVSVTA